MDWLQFHQIHCSRCNRLCRQKVIKQYCSKHYFGYGFHYPSLRGLRLQWIAGFIDFADSTYPFDLVLSLIAECYWQPQGHSDPVLVFYFKIPQDNCLATLATRLLSRDMIQEDGSTFIVVHLFAWVAHFLLVVLQIYSWAFLDEVFIHLCPCLKPIQLHSMALSLLGIHQTGYYSQLPTVTVMIVVVFLMIKLCPQAILLHFSQGTWHFFASWFAHTPYALTFCIDC